MTFHKFLKIKKYSVIQDDTPLAIKWKRGIAWKNDVLLLRVIIYRVIRDL